MKLRRLYSNDESVFPAIRFHDGLNVVFARVKNPVRKDGSSHSLGKTFLADVIDFALLGDLETDHPFKRRRDLFGEFVFALQVEDHEGRHIVIRRPVKARSKICISLFSEDPGNIIDVPDARWTHSDLGQDKAEKLLDGLLGLRDLAPWGYRKGLPYVIRKQDAFGLPFQPPKFAKGKDKDWKPFAAHLLGLDASFMDQRYQLIEQASDLESQISKLEQLGGTRASRIDEIRSVLQAKRIEVERLREELSRFRFIGAERAVNQEVVERLQARLQDLGAMRYALTSEMAEIDRTAEASPTFDADALRAAYEEIGVELPTLLVRRFEEVLDFQRRLSGGRRNRLLARRGKLQDQLSIVEIEAERLDRERADALQALAEAEAFQEYRRLNDQLFKVERESSSLHERLGALDAAMSLREELKQVRSQLQEHDLNTPRLVRGGGFYTRVKDTLTHIAREVLGREAVLFYEINSRGNLDPRIRLTHGDRLSYSEEHRGSSFGKLLAVCLDLTLCRAHGEGRYYRFLYHDGVFEGLDNRRRLALLDYARQEAMRESSLQYILTVIDTDIPRNTMDQKLMFSPSEVVRELHDEGDDGRLFRMKAF